MEKFVVFVLSALLRLWRRLKTHPRIRSASYLLSSREAYAGVHGHEIMLADRVRIDAYYHAIMRHVHEGDVVVDLGTGTGILALFAAQRNPKCVYAIEYSNIIGLAERVSEYNNATDIIRFRPIYSKDFKLDGTVDVIIHEQMGTALFNEKMLEYICDLRDRLLVKGGHIIPHRFELFIGPLSVKDEYRVPFLWEQWLHGVRFDVLKNLKEHDAEKLSQSHHVLPTFHALCFLSDPEKILDIDLLEIDCENLPKSIHYQRVASRSGRMDGFCLYFKVIFDEEISFETNPFSDPTHWNCYFFRTEATYLEQGDSLDVHWDIGDIENVNTWTLKYHHSRAHLRGMPPARAGDVACPGSCGSADGSGC